MRHSISSLLAMHARLMVGFALAAVADSAGAQHAPDIAPYLMPDRAAEVALARTAAPSDVSAKATVLVLARTGYTEAERGTNGFTCVVMRSFAAATNDPGFWNPRVRAPHCFNAPAARTVLPAMLAQAAWVLAGATPAELDAKIRKAYADKTFPMPAVGAMAYMLSPKQYLSDDGPHWMPHLMFYFDRSFAASTFGAGGFSAPVIDASAGDPNAQTQVLYVPTRNWSDGTPAVHPPPGK
jgi:hypothetical protein